MALERNSMLEWRMWKKRKHQFNTTRAQGLVEFAIILPVLLVSIFVLIEFGRLFHAWLAVENGARYGVRYAVTGEYDPQYCAHGASADGVCQMEEDEPLARIASIHDVVWAGSTSILRTDEDEVNPEQSTYFNVLVCDPADLIVPGSTYGTHDCPPSEDPGDPGEKVLIVVEFNHPLVVPLLNSVWPQLRLTSMREATVETFRIEQAEGTPPVFQSPTPRPTNTPMPTNTPPPYYSPTPSIPLCFEEGGWYAMHYHDPYANYDQVGTEFHEGHGLPDGPMALQTVIIDSVTLNQEAVDTIETIERVQVGWRDGTTQWITWGGPAEQIVTIPIGIEMPIVPEGWLWCGYRATYTTFDLRGPIDGNYKMTLRVYIPEYDHYCEITSAYYSVPPTDEPPKDTSTPGPSPTPDPPTNTPDPDPPPPGSTPTTDPNPPTD